MTVWVAYAGPEYTPIAVADSIAELAAMTGANRLFISSSASKLRNGQQKNGKFARVEIDDEEVEDDSD